MRVYLTTERYTLIVWATVLSQLKACALWCPFAIRRSRCVGLSSRESKISAKSSVDLGSNSMPASPTTSGMLEQLEATTAVPHDMASRGGMPKPSYREGKIKATLQR